MAALHWVCLGGALVWAAVAVRFLRQIRDELREHTRFLQVHEILDRSIAADLASINTPRVLP
jgi:hypothetical protein